MRLSSRLSDIDRERLISSHPWCLCVLPCGPCVFPCCVLVFSPCALCYLSRVFFVTSRVCSFVVSLVCFSSFVFCDLCFCLVVFGFLPVVLCSLPLFCSSCLMKQKKKVQKSGDDKKIQTNKKSWRPHKVLRRLRRKWRTPQSLTYKKK